MQDIDAQVLGAPVVGPAYRPNTVMGTLHPDEKRKDLRPGRSIELSLGGRQGFFQEFMQASTTGTAINKNDEGKEYWLLITPPLAIKGIPIMYGKSGRSRIVFTMQVKR